MQKGGDAKAFLKLIDELTLALSDGKMASACSVSKEEVPFVMELGLLTAKPIVFVCNVGEEDAARGNVWSKKVEERWARSGCRE